MRFGYPADQLYRLGPDIRRGAARADILIPADHMSKDWHVSYGDIPLSECWAAQVLTPELIWSAAHHLVGSERKDAPASLH